MFAFDFALSIESDVTPTVNVPSAHMLRSRTIVATGTGVGGVGEDGAGRGGRSYCMLLHPRCFANTTCEPRWMGLWMYTYLICSCSCWSDSFGSLAPARCT